MLVDVLRTLLIPFCERNDSMDEPTCSYASRAAPEKISDNIFFYADARYCSPDSRYQRKESNDERLICVVPACLRSDGDGACAEERGYEERHWV